MRRALLAAALGGLLLTAAACDSGAESTDAAAPAATVPSAAPTSPAPDYTADTKLVCGKVSTIFSDDMTGFHTEMGKMIARKEANETADAEKAEKAARAQLKSVGAKIKKETAAAQDPDLQTAGAASAAKLAKSAADARFFDSIKTEKDLDSRIEARLVDWMNPVTGFCAV
jgi:hypothetical protein